MKQETLGIGLTKRDVLNRISYLPDFLRDLGAGDEAENIECLIEELKKDLYKGF